MFNVGDILKNPGAPSFLFKFLYTNKEGQITLQWSRRIKGFDSINQTMHNIVLNDVIFDGTISTYTTYGFYIFARAPETIENMILSGQFK